MCVSDWTEIKPPCAALDLDNDGNAFVGVYCCECDADDGIERVLEYAWDHLPVVITSPWGLTAYLIDIESRQDEPGNKWTVTATWEVPEFREEESPDTSNDRGFRSPSAQRLYERVYRELVKSRYMRCEVFEFLSAESRGEGSLASEIANGFQKFCDLVVIHSAPHAVLIDLVKEQPGAMITCDQMLVCGFTKFIGCDLGQSLLLYMGRLDGRYARLFLHPESARCIGNKAKYDPSTNTVTVKHTLLCPMVTIHYSSEPRPLMNP